ncbi:MAG: zinc-binding dehydrogenase [Acidimicrobiia bacterium]|nr:zinc-binding dehydrogenase [Acidimicrobiia bacterium]
MKALVASPGTEASIDLVEVDDPAPKPDEVLVDVRAVSLNRGEVHRLQNAEAGWRPGWDVAGVVVGAATDGSGPKPGTPVVGLVGSGAWAERAAVSTGHLARLPDNVTFEDAATLPVAGLTARKAIEMCVIDGKRVAITGAAGGVGRFAVQLAAQNGAEVTAVVGRPERAKGLPELGAAEVVVGTLPADGEEFTLILESAGGESLAAALHRIAPEGTIVSIGNSSGHPTTFEPSAFYRKAGARLCAFMLFPELQRSRTVTTDLRYLANLVAEAHLDTGIDRVVDGSDIAAVRSAITALLDREVDGKAVVTFGA